MNVFRASAPSFCFSNSAETLPKGATQFCSALRKGFSRIRKAKWRQRSPKNVRNFVHTHLSTLGPIRAALTSQDLSLDIKFGPFQSRETLPLIQNWIIVTNISLFLAVSWTPLSYTLAVSKILSGVQDTAKKFLSVVLDTAKTSLSVSRTSLRRP